MLTRPRARNAGRSPDSESASAAAGTGPFQLDPGAQSCRFQEWTAVPKLVVSIAQGSVNERLRSMEIEAKIAAMGLELPELPPQKTRRVRATRTTSNLVYLAGHGPFKDGGYPFKGPVGEAISVEDASAATR